MEPEEVTEEIVEAADEGLECYVRGAVIPGYDGYCPITWVWAYKQEDGTYLGGHPASKFEESDIVEKPGFLVVHLGSIERDHTVETAANALHHSLESLFAACDIPVDFERIRTTVELSEFMKQYRSNYSHVVLIGHGSTDGISFLDKPGPIAGGELAGCLGSDASDKKLQIISLCCHSGCANLAKALSAAPNITEVLAPNDAFDMRWAVHFVTGYFLSMYINGLSVNDATLHAAETSGNAPICIWKDGELIGSCAKPCN